MFELIDGGFGQEMMGGICTPSPLDTQSSLFWFLCVPSPWSLSAVSEVCYKFDNLSEYRKPQCPSI